MFEPVPQLDSPKTLAATSPPNDGRLGLNPRVRPVPHWAPGVKHRATSIGMGIARSRFMRATKCLRHLAFELLDLTLSSHQQDPAKWKLFLSRLCAADPIFLDYEHLWPVALYFDEWISDTRRIPVRSNPANCQRGLPYARKKYDTVTVHVRHHGSADSGHTHMGRHCDSSHCREGDKLKQQSRAPFGKTDTSHTTSVSSASQGADRDAEDFRYLLQALNPRIDDLFPNFIRNGVRDLDALRTVATFPPSTFGIFTREDLGLNPFEVHKVTLALRSLTGE